MPSSRPDPNRQYAGGGPRKGEFAGGSRAVEKLGCVLRGQGGDDLGAPAFHPAKQPDDIGVTQCFKLADRGFVKPEQVEKGRSVEASHGPRMPFGSARPNASEQKGHLCDLTIGELHARNYM